MQNTLLPACICLCCNYDVINVPVLIRYLITLPVYTHMCSMRVKDHLHAANVNFHNVGIGGVNFINDKGWQLQTLSTIRRRLRHDKVRYGTIIYI